MEKLNYKAGSGKKLEIITTTDEGEVQISCLVG
jgi:hypothetical protein